MAASTRSGVAGRARDAGARGVVDGVEDGGCGGDQRLLADALGAEGPGGGGALDRGSTRWAARRRWWGSGSRAGSRRGPGVNSSISAMPMPCATPPSIWPSTSMGLMARPTSCAATMRRTLHACRAACRPRPPPDARHSHRRHRERPGHRHRAARSADRRFPPHTEHSRGRRAAGCARSTVRTTVVVAHHELAAVEFDSVAPSPALASRSSMRRSARPARSAAVPVTKVWREAEVLPQSGVRSVSAETRSIERQRQAHAHRPRSGR